MEKETKFAAWNSVPYDIINFKRIFDIVLCAFTGVYRSTVFGKNFTLHNCNDAARHLIRNDTNKNHISLSQQYPINDQYNNGSFKLLIYKGLNHIGSLLLNSFLSIQ